MNMPAMQTAATHGDVGAPWSVIRQQTVIEIVAQGCAEDPERPAIIVEDGLVLSRRELRDRCERFAGFLRGRVRPGERAVVMLDNRIEFMIALFGLIANRATLVSIAPTAQQHDAGHILRDSEPVLAIVGAPQQEVIEQLRPDCPSLKEILVVDGEEPDGLGRFERNAVRLDLDGADCQRDDIVTVFYTSGTTGAPKGCMLDHGWWLRVLDADQRLFPRSWQDRQLCCLPFYYADPAIQLLTSLSTRGTMIAMRRFSVSRFWDVVRNYDATEVLSIASIPALLLKGEPGPRERDHRIRLAIHAGLPKQLHAQMVERFGFHWLDNYGSTEGGIMARVPLSLADELVGAGSIGVEAPEVEIRVADDDDKDVPAGAIGEALIRGPDLFRGYLNRPEVTAEAMRDGWYHSGDLVRRDERGLLYFVGRKKDMIRRSGENISAAEVEAVIRSHPKVLEVAVIPVPDEMRGEEVKAYILPKEGGSAATLPPDEIIAFCAERLAAYKVPRYLEYRTEEFERTPSMRVQKQALLKERDDLIAGCWDRESGRFR
ncbi:MAG: AMP-binding protein [Kiloniellales bacterium]